MVCTPEVTFSVIGHGFPDVQRPLRLLFQGVQELFTFFGFLVKNCFALLCLRKIEELWEADLLLGFTSWVGSIRHYPQIDRASSYLCEYAKEPSIE